MVRTFLPSDPSNNPRTLPDQAGLNPAPGTSSHTMLASDFQGLYEWHDEAGAMRLDLHLVGPDALSGTFRMADGDHCRLQAVLVEERLVGVVIGEEHSGNFKAWLSGPEIHLDFSPLSGSGGLDDDQRVGFVLMRVEEP